MRPALRWLAEWLAGKRDVCGNLVPDKRGKTYTEMTPEERRWLNARFKLLVEVERIRRRREAEWEDEVVRTAALASYRAMVVQRKPWKKMAVEAEKNDPQAHRVVTVDHMTGEADDEEY